jgi:hypothetical protein
MKMMRILLMVMVVAMGFGFTACKKRKAAKKTEDVGVNPKQQGETLINEYCSGDQYLSTKDAFRATATGESMDRETAKKKAKSNAMSELSKTVSATMKVVGDNYVNSSEVNNKEQLTETFQEMARTVVDQNLKGAVEICEKLTQKADGSYVSYVAIELSGERISSAYNEKLSKDEKLKADYNYEKFKETFEKEMNKMAEDQK